LLYSKFEGNPSTEWQEAATNLQYLQIKREVSPDVSTGVISLDNPWLAASPDGLVYDPTEQYPNGVVEFKNPYAAWNIMLKEAAAKTTFCLEHNKDSDTLKLKNKHNYYYQVQCTMYGTQRNWCDLATDVHIERIITTMTFGSKHY